MIYLRPAPSNRPVKYIESIEKAGLVVAAKEAIAIYTSKSTPNQGPQGPQGPQGEPGVDQNSWFDTIIAAASDEVTSIDTGGPKTTFRSPYPLDLTTGHVRCSLTTGPVGAAFIVDLHMNGTTIFSTPMSIDDGEDTSVTSSVPAVLQTTYVPDDAKFEVYVTQVGVAVPGAGLKVAVTGIKTT